ncbi:MAG: 2-amino-4-hydroxy-6-hydroxymethyldihydropteridine diphosphokinase [Halothiobacillus sp.]|jgi:2-amino-4-hydroxy-6-hydroxymethyldihydropteridine diphosphokinase|uniref:2-amino-4-hydroxy-6- hydroxymethyldihydropteridine diphosphokinase n=1 Tax=Halothiobacillus sp. TaxID=1891311 RepID=UPI002AD371B0|nr:2-amino-4-hydroxy-6-hydroxymethyldihydropteridine diphosphokinase [Halothiobacillus sp.]MDA3876635.1 2-amino-4-hydroxy-6-hydroxymethyldihydropteridine diphosphokinase [Halothiobacillus sp.]
MMARRDRPSGSVEAMIALGSNLGHPIEQLERAFQALDRLPQTSVERCSMLYANPPMGPQDQPDYVNAVALLVTRLSPGDLLNALKALEQAAGRYATRYWGERVLDLDILTYGDLIIDTRELTVPHPGIADRRFVLAPWHEIAPDAVLPDHRRIADLLAASPEHALRVIPRAVIRSDPTP